MQIYIYWSVIFSWLLLLFFEKVLCREQNTCTIIIDVSHAIAFYYYYIWSFRIHATKKKKKKTFYSYIFVIYLYVYAYAYKFHDPIDWKLILLYNSLFISLTILRLPNIIFKNKICYQTIEQLKKIYLLCSWHSLLWVLS